MILKDIEQILKAIKEIEKIKKAIYKRKKDSKENFNFFHALVTDKKIRLEKYHTNFIGYLLNTKQNHDCGVLFFESFLKLIKEEHEKRINEKHEIACIDTLNHAISTIDNKAIDLNHVIVTIEKQTTEGRFIDIVVEYKNEWILFIENKMDSGESENQLKDYYKFCFDKINEKQDLKDKKPIGIFLTQSGDEPSTSEDSRNIISISYSQIIDWLEKCISQLSGNDNITYSLKQYIVALKHKHILNIMDNEEMKDFKPYLDENFLELPSLGAIDSFKNAVIKYSGNHEKRKIFYERLIKLLKHDLEGEKSEKGFIEIGRAHV